MTNDGIGYIDENFITMCLAGCGLTCVEHPIKIPPDIPSGSMKNSESIINYTFGGCKKRQAQAKRILNGLAVQRLNLELTDITGVKKTSTLMFDLIVSLAKFFDIKNLKDKPYQLSLFLASESVSPHNAEYALFLVYNDGEFIRIT